MTGWYTEPCLIRNPWEARIMSSYLHDCQGTGKNSVRGCSATTSYCSDSRASRQLLSNPRCGLALECLYISWMGPLALSFIYFFIFVFKRIHAIVGCEAECVSWCCPVQVNLKGPAKTSLINTIHFIIRDLFVACTCCSSLLIFFLLFSSPVSSLPLWQRPLAERGGNKWSSLFSPLLISSPYIFSPLR